MKKIVFVLAIICCLSSCATVFYQNEKAPGYGNEEYLGHVKCSTFTWSWTNFGGGNDRVNEKLYSELQKKAKIKYGDDVYLKDMFIEDNIQCNVGLHAGALVAGGLVASILNPDENAVNDEDINISYGLLYLLTLGKVITAKADVYRITEFLEAPEGETDSRSTAVKSNRQAPVKMKGKIVEKYDDFKDVTFISHSYLSDKPISIYIGKNKNDKWLRMKFRYTGSDWIFFDEAILINSEGKRASWTFKTWEKTTDVFSSGGVLEYIDISLTDYELENIEELLRGSVIKLRLTGDHYKDYSLDKYTTDALMMIIDEYRNISF